MFDQEPPPSPPPPPWQSKWNSSDPPSGGDLTSFEASFIVNSTTWEAVVEAIANAKGQIMFSTFQGAHDGMLQMTANFYAWLSASELDHNMLFMSEDMESCRLLWKFGMPCWYDELCPRGEELPAGNGQQAHPAETHSQVSKFHSLACILSAKATTVLDSRA